MGKDPHSLHFQYTEPAMNSSYFQEILERANIDVDLLRDPDDVLEKASFVLFDVMLSHADGDESQPVSEEERRAILKEVADRLIRELHDEFHRR